MPTTAQLYLRLRPADSYQGAQYSPDYVGHSLLLSGPAFDKRHSFYFERVFTSIDPFPSMFSCIIQPQIADWISGFNVSIFTLGCTGGGKTHIMDGIIHEITENLFHNIPHTHSLSFQSFEIYGEVAKDLSTRSKDGLSLSHDQNGSFVSGCQTCIIESETQLRDIVSRCMDNRTLLRDKSTGDKIIIIHRLLLINRSTGIPLSKFTLVETFAAEKLVEDPTKLSMREGTFVANTITSFRRVIESSGALMGLTFNYKNSVATELLADEFGGNCKSKFILCLHPGHSPVINQQILTMFDKIKDMILYPVKNDDNLYALFSFLRRHDGIPLNDVKTNDIKELQGIVSNTKISHMRIQVEVEKLKSRLEDLSTRYEATIQSKLSLEKKYIKNQSETQAYKKALLESHNDTKDSKQTYGNSDQKILSLQADLAELNKSLDKYSRENQLLRKQLQDSKDDLKTSQTQCAILNENYSNIESQLESTQKKLEDVNIEVVNLVNQKNQISKIKNESGHEYEKIVKHNLFLAQRVEALERSGYSSTSSNFVLDKNLYESQTRAVVDKQKLETEVMRLQKINSELESKITKSDNNTSSIQQLEARIAKLSLENANLIKNEDQATKQLTAISQSYRSRLEKCIFY